MIINALQVTGAIAQESSKGNLELPPIIVEEKSGQIQVRAGSKKEPNKTAALTQQELDSLNSLDKEKSFLLAAKKLPDKIVEKKFNDGFLKAQFGRFTSPAAEFGYSFRMGAADEYDFYVNSALDMSNGHIDNSDYKKFYVDLTNIYIAPDKFWVFGGSRTKTQIHVDRSEYNLYAADSAAPARDALNLNFTMDSDGFYSGVKFETGLGLRTMNLKTDEAKAYDNSLSAYLNIKGYIGDLELGGKALVDLHSVRGDGVHFAQAYAVLNYFVPEVSFVLNAGAQFSSSSNDIARTGLYLAAELEYRISRLLTLKASFVNAMDDKTLKDYFVINPYIHQSVPIDFRNNRQLKGFLYIHPTAEFTIGAGAQLGIFDRNPYFITDTLGSFRLGYNKTSEFRITGEIDWHFTDNDLLTANASFINAEIDTNSSIVPYIPKLQLSAAYRRTWFKTVATEIGVCYSGKRFADIENDIELDAFINLNALVDIKISDTFTVFGKVENLLNSDVYVWEGYKERGLFVTGGIFWTF